MEDPAGLEEVLRQLDGLARELAAGGHEKLEQHIARLDASAAVLRELAEAGRQGRPLGPAPGWCIEIRSRIALIREMLAHGEQVRSGLTGILGLLCESHTGSQYSARGAPALSSVPRVLAEG